MSTRFRPEPLPAGFSVVRHDPLPDGFEIEHPEIATGFEEAARARRAIDPNTSARAIEATPQAAPNASKIEKTTARLDRRSLARQHDATARRVQAGKEAFDRDAQTQSEIDRLASSGIRSENYGISTGKIAGMADDEARRRLDSAHAKINADRQGGDSWATSLKKTVQNLDDQIIGQGGGGLVESLPQTLRYLAAVAGNPSGLLAPETDAERAVSQAGRGMYQRATRELQRNAVQTNDPSKKFASDLVSGATSMLTALGVTAVTKNPEAGIAVLSAQAFGSQYGQSIEQGRSKQAAFVDASWMAAAEALGENKVIGEILKPGQTFAKRVVNSALGEAMQEGFTGTLQHGYEAGVLDPTMTIGDVIRATAYDALLGGAVGGGSASLVGGGSALRERFRPVNAPGVIETATQSSQATPEDIASPLSRVVDLGAAKTLVAGARGKLEADSILTRNSAPATGSMVEVMGKRWTVEDAFTDDEGQDGVTLSRDGKKQKIYFGDLADAGIGLTTIADPRGSLDEAVAAAAPGTNLPIPTAPREQAGPVSGREQLKARIRRAENNTGDINAKNPKSSASGIYQFTDATFDAYYRKVYGTAPPAGVKNDPAVQEKLMDSMTSENEARLKKAGFETTAGNLYLAHFAGPQGAINLLRNPNGSAAAILGPRATASNRSIVEGKTGAEVAAWAARKMGGSVTSPTALGTPRFSDGTAAEPENDHEFSFLHGGEEATTPAAQQAMPEARDQPLIQPEPAAAERPDDQGLKLYHGSPRADLTIDDIEIVRAPGSSKQGKKGRSFGGFYATDQHDQAKGYADMAGSAGTVYDVSLKPGAVVEQHNGEITRLSPAVIDSYRARGVDVLVGKDPRGRTEHAIINRDAIANFNPAGDGSRVAPLEVRTAADLERATERVNTAPTEGQIEAGNYAKSHIKVQGIDIAIENPKGSERSGTDPDGKAWSVTMPSAYGYVKRTVGQDDEQVDVYVGDQPDSDRVFVIDQVHADTKAPDEHKAMIGFPSEEAARSAYHDAFSDGRGPDRIGAVTEMPVTEFKSWLKNGDTTKPIAPAAGAIARGDGEQSPSPTAPIRVYHGGPGVEGEPRAPFFATEDQGFAQTYADDRGRGQGKVEAFDIAPTKIASEDDIQVAARRAGVSEAMISQATGGMLLDGNFTDGADKVVADLRAQGFDAARFDDFAVDEENDAKPTIAVLNPAIAKRADSSVPATNAISGESPVIPVAASTPVAEPTPSTSENAPSFDPAPHIGKLRSYIASGTGTLNDIGKVAKALDLPVEQTHAVMGAVASRPGAGFRMTKGRPAVYRTVQAGGGRTRKVLVTKGVPPRYVRDAKSDAPKSVMAFVRGLGGINDPRHDLRNVGGLRNHPGVISSKGRSVDEIGRALWEDGRFPGKDPSDPDQRPTEAETLELLDRESQGKRASPQSSAPSEEEARASAGDAIKVALKESGGLLPAIVSNTEREAIIDEMLATGDDAASAAYSYFERKFTETVLDAKEQTADDSYDIPFELGASDEAFPDSRDDGAVSSEDRGRSASEARDEGGSPAAGADRGADGGQAGQLDAFGTRQGDQRTALERKGEGRIQSDKTQKAPGSDGGLFDSGASQGTDLLDAPKAKPAEPIAQARAALQQAMAALDAAEAPAAEPEGTTDVNGRPLSKESEAAQNLYMEQTGKQISQTEIQRLNSAIESGMSRADAVKSVREFFEKPIDWDAERKAFAEETARKRAAAPQYSLSGSGEEVFYSALERAVEASPTKRAPAAQWAATLGKTPGVKREELEWSGVFDWLDMQTGPVDREALLGVIRDGGIKVEEVTLGEAGSPRPNQDDYEDFNEYEDARDAWIERQQETGAQFKDWSSDPSNPTYRELLITLPRGQGSNPERAPSTHWDTDAVVAHARFMEKTDAEGRRVLFIEEVQSDWHQKGRDEGYEKTLAPEEMAARDADLTDADKAAETARADLYAAAQRIYDAMPEASRTIRGFRAPNDPMFSEAWARPTDKDTAAQAIVLYAADTTTEDAVDEELRGVMRAHSDAMLKVNEARQAASRRTEGSIPEAPFKASWPALVMKRMIRHVVDNGYDAIAWTTGAEQAERYNLAQAVGSIEAARMADGTYDVKPYKQAALDKIVEAFGTGPYSPEKVREIYGADLGRRIMAAADAAPPNTSYFAPKPGDGEMVTLDGGDLTVGGEGMKAFYDRNLVNITNDIGKKYGAKVGKVEIRDSLTQDQKEELAYAEMNVSDAESEAERAEAQAIVDRLNSMRTKPGLTLTPALKEAARGGFPLFQQGETAITPQNIGRIQERLKATMERLGIADRVLLRTVERMDAANAHGSYWRRVITVALNSSDPIHTINHEAIHALRALNVILPDEWTALVKAARADTGLWDSIQRRYAGRNLNTLQMEEEAVADLFGNWSAAREAKGFIGRAFQRVTDLLKTIVAAFDRVTTGNRQPGQIFRNIESGQVGRRGQEVRAVEPVEDGIPLYSIGEDAPKPERGLRRHAFRDANIEVEYLTHREFGPSRPKKMTPGNYDLYARKIMLDEIAQVGDMESLPWGMHEISFLAAKARIDKAVTASPEVEQAVRRYYQSQALTEAAEGVTPEDIRRDREEDEEAFKAANIRLDKIEGTSEIRDALKAAAEDMGDFVGARRGKVTHEETKKLADELDMSVDQLMARRKGQAFNAHELYAARAMLVASADNMVELASKADGGSDSDLINFRKAWIRHVAIQEQVSGMTAEAGRALNQFKLLARSGADLNARMMKDLVEINGGRDDLEAVAKSILGFSKDPARLNRHSRGAFNPTWRDKLFELWINGLLSGPATHVVNTVSNTMTAVTQIPEYALASGIGKIRSLAKPDTDRILRSEMGARTVALITGAREAAQLAAEALRTGEGSDALSKLEARTQRAISGKKGEVIRIPSRLLIASDEFFKGVARRMELAAQAARIATLEGLSGDAYKARTAELLAEPTDDMIEKAMDFARYSTFQTPLGEMGRAVSNFINKVPGMRVVVPFMRTPANIFKFAIARTPAAPILREVRDDLAAGGSRGDLAIARILMGSGIMALAGVMAASGLLTGSDPDDDDARRLLRAKGWQPYSVKIGDTYYSYSRLDPLATVLGLAADLVGQHENMSESERDKASANLFKAILGQLKNKTFLSGIGDLIQSIEDPDRFLPQWLGRMAGTVIPTGIAQVTNAIDPTVRDTNPTKHGDRPGFIGGVIDGAENIGQIAKNRIMSRIPGLSDNLMPKRDIWGRVVVREGGVGPDVASPFWTARDQKDDVAGALLRAGVNLDVPKRRVAGVELTPQQYDDYQALAGQFLRNGTERLVRSPRWQRVDDERRTAMFDKLKNGARKAARERLGLTKGRLERQAA